MARSVDVFTDPAMSYVTDSTRSRFGRRIPYMICGAPVYAVAIILLLGGGVINPPETSAECALNGTEYVLDGDGNIENFSMAVWYGATFIFFYMADTVCNVPYNALAPELSDSSDERENIYFVQNLFGMVGTMVGAVAPPLLESMGVEKTYSFLYTGVFFAIYYCSTQANLAMNVGERVEGYEDSEAVPLIPATVRSLSVQPFRILLMAWFIDAVGWFALASVLPFYVKYYLQPGKAGIEWLSDEIFLGVALCALFVAAIFGMPFWKLCARYFGRYKTWLAYNLWNGMSNALYILVQPQDWKLALIVTVFNGIPFGGR